MRITKQAINLRRRNLRKLRRPYVIYFEPLDRVYSNKTDGVSSAEIVAPLAYLIIDIPFCNQ